MKKLFFAFIALLFLGGTVSQTYSQENQSRVWKSRDGKHRLEARMLSYDTDAKKVRLESDSGETFEIDLSKLSSADRRYVTKSQSEKSGEAPNPFQKTGDAKNHSGNSNLNSDPDSDAKPKRGSDKPNSRRVRRNSKRVQRTPLYGLEWTDMASAGELASGNPNTHRDDRPIMWFRVLGQLDGFM